ncbi:NPCBM/NEW2 domain-containing protein [Nonomuraea cavernae]|uniref:NPCBM/NEW2 domain-containing protein n=1 Tax=Nonomuraea cavernae TaxID=2045107 RepID=UPI0033C52AB4
MARNTSAGGVAGQGHEIRVARISARGTIMSALITGVATVVVAVIGVRFAPTGISQAIAPNAAVTHTVTATTTVTATPPITSVTPVDTTGPGVALTTSNAVSHEDCYVSGDGSNSWYDTSVSLDSSGAQLPALTCRINWAGAATGHVDYLVPASAREFAAQAGIDRLSPNTTAQVRFEVLAVDGSKLASATATYQNPQPIKVTVTGGTRIRLKVTMVRSTEEVTTDDFVRVAWAAPAFA